MKEQSRLEEKEQHATSRPVAGDTGGQQAVAKVGHYGRLAVQMGQLSLLREQRQPIRELQRVYGNQLIQQEVAALEGARAARPNHGTRRAETEFPSRNVIEKGIGKRIPGSWEIDESIRSKTGMEAVTKGTLTTFASATPSLEVAAHEAVHQLQHDGSTRDFGLGAEGHAALVATRLAAGMETRSLIGFNGDAVAPATRGYKEISGELYTKYGVWDDVPAPPLRVSNTGLTVTNHNKHDLFAHPALVIKSNQILDKQNAGVRLYDDSSDTVRGPAPDGGGTHTLNRVNPFFSISITDFVNTPSFYQDCGRAARELVGPTGSDAPLEATYCDDAERERTTVPRREARQYPPEILQSLGLGSTPEEALAKYGEMSEAEADAFDKKHRINRYASPGVGEAYTKSVAPSYTSGVKHHFAAVIMATGGDRITLESWAQSGLDYDDKNTKWMFETYGSPASGGKTFDESFFVGTRSSGAMTVAVRQKNYDHLSTRELLAVHDDTSLEADERKAAKAALRRRWIYVRVDIASTRSTFSDDEVYIVIESPQAKEYKSGQAEIGDGDSHTFKVSFGNVLSSGAVADRMFRSGGKSDPITVSVYEAGWGGKRMLWFDWERGTFAMGFEDGTWERDDYSARLSL